MDTYVCVCVTQDSLEVDSFYHQNNLKGKYDDQITHSILQ